MTFSIIVPVFNAENHLSAGVASVMRQTYPDFELILVDDGSTDGTAALCDDLASKNPQIRVIHQQNSRQLLSRINGVGAARGDYCLFLDADDVLEPDCLRTLEEKIRRYNNPDMLIYSFYYESEDGTRKEAPPLFPTERLFGSEDKTDLCERFFSGTALNNVWTKAVRRAVFDRPHPDYAQYASLRCAEDRLQSMVMVSNAETVACLPAHLYSYRLLSGSMTRQFSPGAVDRFNTCILYPFELECIRAWGLPPDETVLRLNASYIAQALYVLDRFYRNMPDKADRERLLHISWQSFVPTDCTGQFEKNPYLNDTQKAVFSMMLRADADGLERHFRRKTRVRKLRDLKHKLFSK